MAFLPLLFLLPILEMYLLIRVGNYLGALPTVALVLGTAAVGLALLRRQGPRALLGVQARLQVGELPVRELAAGALLALAGLMLLMPGFITDAMGIALLLPDWRERLATRLVARLGQQYQPPAGSGRVIIEGEFERRQDPERDPFDDSGPRLR